METRTVDVLLHQFDGKLAARLTIAFPPPSALTYGGRQWRRTGGNGNNDAIYQPERPFTPPDRPEEAIVPRPFVMRVRSRS
jgi:hypothetical protein